MADKQILKGTSSQIREVFIQDTRQSDGSGLTGLLFNSASLTAYYMREGAGASVQIALQTMTIGTWATGGFIEVDAVNLPGVYQLGIPNAALLTGANGVTIMLKGAANMAPVIVYIHLTAVDHEDAVRFGLTALPNAAAGATGGLDCTVSLGGTASAGGNTTITLAGGSAVDNYYNHQIVQITAGAGVGQANVIVGYVGSTKVATIGRAWKTNPDNTSVFQVMPPIAMSPWNLLEGTLSAASATTATLSGGVATDNYYNGALVFIGAGTGAGQARIIAGYVGGTAVATLDRAWATTPDSTSVYVVLAGEYPKLDSSLQVAANAVNGNVTGSVASVTAAVDILQTAADKVWSSAARTLTAFAQGFSDQTWASATRTLTAFAQGFADQVWTTAARTLTAFGFSVTVSTNNDKTGYALSGAGVQAIWDALTAASVVVGSIGIKLKNWALGTDNRALVSADVHTSGETVAGVTAPVLLSEGVGANQILLAAGQVTSTNGGGGGGTANAGGVIES